MMFFECPKCKTCTISIIKSETATCRLCGYTGSAESFLFKTEEKVVSVPKTRPRVLELEKELADARAEIERMREAARAYQELATCYRLGKRPTEKLFKRLGVARAALEVAERSL